MWADAADSGFLDRHQLRGAAFSYAPNINPERAISLTMPYRLASWNTAFGLAPFFEMNLPEGALRERLRLSFAKATGSFDDFDLLGIVGRSQVGRIRYTGQADSLDEDVPFQSVDEILERRRSGSLFRHLLERFARFSGISGVQPKIMLRDEGASAPLSKTHHRASHTHRGATHIVKFWEPNEYPHLAANEFFCLKAAEACGLELPRFRLAEDAAALVIDRFDLREDAAYRGFEDFCVLNARGTGEKYRGSYETSILKRFSQFALSPHVNEDLERLYILIVLNCALRNGDAHLKNFGIIYDNVLGEARLSPVYDLVTTTVYLPEDTLALTLDGNPSWPSRKQLARLGETRLGASPSRVRAILDRVATSIEHTTQELRAYQNDNPGFQEIGNRMLTEWSAGIRHSLLPA